MEFELGGFCLFPFPYLFSVLSIAIWAVVLEVCCIQMIFLHGR